MMTYWSSLVKLSSTRGFSPFPATDVYKSLNINPQFIWEFFSANAVQYSLWRDMFYLSPAWWPCYVINSLTWHRTLLWNNPPTDVKQRYNLEEFILKLRNLGRWQNNSPWTIASGQLPPEQLPTEKLSSENSYLGQWHPWQFPPWIIAPGQFPPIPRRLFASGQLHAPKVLFYNLHLVLILLFKELYFMKNVLWIFMEKNLCESQNVDIGIEIRYLHSTASEQYCI